MSWGPVAVSSAAMRPAERTTSFSRGIGRAIAVVLVLVVGCSPAATPLDAGAMDAGGDAERPDASADTGRDGRESVDGGPLDAAEVLDAAPADVPLTDAALDVGSDAPEVTSDGGTDAGDGAPIDDAGTVGLDVGLDANGSDAGPVVTDLDWRASSTTVHLAAGEVRYFRFTIAPDCDGAPFAGWLLDTVRVSSGAFVSRLREGALPTAASGSLATNAVLVPPDVGPGVFYVSVEAGVAAGDVVLVSREMAALRTFALPRRGETPSTPGVVAPSFADTGVAADGTPRPGDGGSDLARSQCDFFVVDVPTGNAGILSAYVEASLGEVSLYLRHGSGVSGGRNDFSDARNGSRWVHVVPVDARETPELPPGPTWLAVCAGSADARYRLRLSAGRFEPLALQGGLVSGATLAAGDMRHFRVTVPASSVVEASSSPLAWHLDLVETSGDVVAFVRARIPAGFAPTTPLAADVTTSPDLRDWRDDVDDVWGTPSVLSSPVLDASGRATLTSPALAPGTEYVVSVFARSDAVFGLGSSIGTARLHVDGVLAFDGGVVGPTVLPPGATRTFRLDVPADAARLRVLADIPDGVWLFAQPETLPPSTTGAAFTNGGFRTSASLDVALYTDDAPFAWPWSPSRAVYVVVENRTLAPAPFTLTTDGRDVLDDSDADGLPDAWEGRHFGSLATGGLSDVDLDGVSNAVELALRTDPADPDSDDDDLTDGDELAAGLEPTDADSDDDLCCDGADTQPSDPGVCAP